MRQYTQNSVLEFTICQFLSYFPAHSMYLPVIVTDFYRIKIKESFKGEIKSHTAPYRKRKKGYMQEQEKGLLKGYISLDFCFHCCFFNQCDSLLFPCCSNWTYPDPYGVALTWKYLKTLVEKTRLTPALSRYKQLFSQNVLQPSSRHLVRNDLNPQFVGYHSTC